MTSLTTCAPPRPFGLTAKHLQRQVSRSSQPRRCAGRRAAAEGRVGPAAEVAAAPAALAPQHDDAGGQEAADEEDDEWMELPEAQHVLKVPDFAPELVRGLRAHYDERLGDPLRAAADRFCWDCWHVPGQYHVLRTPADAFFPPPLHEALVDALLEHGERQLGCRGISPLWLSCYVDGCRQEWHSDAPHGPFAFVLSLTRWQERKFSGGETMMLQPWVLDYWRTFQPGVGTETPQLLTDIPPEFGQLTVFDGRIPHGVRQVEGTRDPLEGRLVLHGWYTQPSPFFQGPLSEEAATPALNECLQGLYTELGSLPPVVGTLTLRLEVEGPSGRVADLRWLADTLVARPQGGGEAWEVHDANLACIAQHLLAARFPPSGANEPSLITLPFIFE